MSGEHSALSPIARCLRPPPPDAGVVVGGIYRYGDGVRADFLAPHEYQGHPGIVHGGVSAMLLDEVMGYAVVANQATHAITQRLRITYISPVPTGENHYLQAQLESFEGDFGVVLGNIFNQEGELLVTATGLFRLENDIAANFALRDSQTGIQPTPESRD
ncbi:PaaI family thioesterase [Candidatus Thiosymbion oneisti]|uniref:PaaI family thioesterase n=1 Tax=Candidatus Thiosymbion oneisti TaxID=589554 RepID=UPI00105BD9F2|nr:PaaI family thioesterase [Candidatus Thiosymbion oneisti]